MLSSSNAFFMMNHQARFSTNNRANNPSALRTFSTQTATKSEGGAADIISEEVLSTATSEEDLFIKKLR
jgi:hypothetical protein